MRGQATLFMIIGIVAVVVLLAILFFTQREPTSTPTVSSEFEPLRTYVEECIRGSAIEGLRLLGEQGGLIYRDQGGTTADPLATEGTLYIDDAGVRVTYRIGLPSSSVRCDADWNSGAYPTAIIPYPYGPTWDFSSNAYLAEKTYAREDCFGRRIPLTTRRSLRDLSAYIEQELATSCTFEGFPTLTVEAGDPEIIVVSSERLTTVQARYPLTARAGNSRSTLDQWTVALPFSLDPLYEAANNELRQDVSDPTYDITLSDGPFSVRVDRDAYGHDDLITLRSQTALEGEPYVLRFARQNRPPALEYVHRFAALPTLPPADGDIDYDEILLPSTTLLAVDPDEDIVTTYVLIGTTPSQRLSPTQPYLYNGEGALEIAIIADDGEYQDRQTTDQNRVPLVIT